MLVEAEHLGGMQFRLQLPVDTLITDRGDDNGDPGQGPKPGEYLLSAIAGCFGQSILFVASRMRRELVGLRLAVDGIKDMKTSRLSRVTIAVSSDSPEEVLRKIVKTARKYCFVTNSLSDEVRISLIVAGEPMLP